MLNSDSARFAPAKVIVPPVAESNNTLAVPASHTAPSVEALVHVPDTVQLSEPNVIAEAALEMFTLLVTITVPDVEVKSPPDMARIPLTVSAFVPFASVPPEVVRAVAVIWLSIVRVPPEIVTPPKV